MCILVSQLSSDDEIERLATQTLAGTGRASSTPIKVRRGAALCLCVSVLVSDLHVLAYICRVPSRGEFSN